MTERVHTGLQRTQRWATYWARELRRLWVPIVAMLVLAYWRRQLIDEHPTSEMARILYKVNIVAGAAILAHVLRSQMFPYLDLRRLLERGEATKFLGAAVLVGLVMLAIILGFTLGL